MVEGGIAPLLLPAIATVEPSGATYQGPGTARQDLQHHLPLLPQISCWSRYRVTVVAFLVSALVSPHFSIKVDHWQIMVEPSYFPGTARGLIVLSFLHRLKSLA